MVVLAHLLLWNLWPPDGQAQASLLEEDSHGPVIPFLHQTDDLQKQSFLADHGLLARDRRQSIKEMPFMSRSPLGTPGAQFYWGPLRDSEDLIPQR